MHAPQRQACQLPFLVHIKEARAGRHAGAGGKEDRRGDPSASEPRTQFVGSATNFGAFVENVYRPTTMPLFTRSTQGRYYSIIKNYLKPAFEGDSTPLTVQRFLSGILVALSRI